MEIGLCKLRRDYTHHLMGQELATSKQLEFFVDETVPLTEQVGAKQTSSFSLFLIRLSHCIVFFSRGFVGCFH